MKKVLLFFMISIMSNYSISAELNVSYEVSPEAMSLFENLENTFIAIRKKINDPFNSVITEHEVTQFKTQVADLHITYNEIKPRLNNFVSAALTDKFKQLNVNIDSLQYTYDITQGLASGKISLERQNDDIE